MKTLWAGRRGVLVALALFTVGAAGALWWWVAAEVSTMRPSRRIGPPALVQAGGKRVLWLLTRQEESLPDKGRANQRYHFDLHGHDEATVQRLWTRRLLTVNQPQGVMQAQDGVNRTREFLVSLDLNEGKLQQFDLQAGVPE